MTYNEQRSLIKRLFEHLEDHDNADLPEIEWDLHMEEQVVEFNNEHGCEFHPKNTVLTYIERKYKSYDI